MFSDNLGAILRTLDPHRAPTPRVHPARSAEHERAARRALTQEIRVPPLSERLEKPEAYLALQRQRRDALEALLVAGEDGGCVRTLDLICAICEESRWAAGAGAPFEDEAHPEIDLQAADTAALLGWARCLRGEALDRRSGRIRARMLLEARRRVIDPLLAQEDYLSSTAVLCAAATALIFLEDDPARLSLALKPLLRMLEAAYACAQNALEPLETRLEDACAIADFAFVLHRATAGAANLAGAVPYCAWLDELLFAHVEDDWFFGCAEGVCRARVSGAALYRLGALCGDDALRALGARLHRVRALPSSTATGRLLDVSLEEDLAALGAPAPRLKHAALEDGRLMLARGAGFFCALSSGGNRANAGHFCVFVERAPVLVEGRFALPQLARPLSPPTPDWDFSDDGRAIMGVDVTPAYPQEAGIRAHQRTLLLAREDRGAQLVDVFDLAKPIEARYVFHTPYLPSFFDGGVRLGPMILTWEGRPETHARRLAPTPDFPEGLFEVALTYPHAEQRAMYTFFMRHA